MLSMQAKISTHKNLFFSLFAVTFRLVANVFVFWLLARGYDPYIFGQFTFAHSLATTLIVIADFGFDVFLTTEISATKKNIQSIFWNLFSYKLLFTSFSMSGMLVFAALLNASINTKVLVFLFSFFLASTTLTNFMYALFRGLENLGYEMKVSMIMNSILVVILPILLILKTNIIIIAAVFITSRILGLILAYNYSSQLIGKVCFRDMFQGYVQIRKKMLVFGIHFVFSFLFFQLDTILLLLLKGEYDTGIYQAVFKFVMLPLAIPEIIINVLLPVLTRLFTENKEEWVRVGNLLNKSLLLIIVPISLTLFIYSDELVELVYGAKYLSASPVLKIYSIIILVRFFLEPFALMLTTSARQYIRLYTVVIATILNLVLNLFLIPIAGIKGAAIVSLITNIFVGLTYIVFNKEVLKAWFINKESRFFILVIILQVPIVIFSYNVMEILGLFVIVFFFVFTTKIYLSSNEKKRLLNEITNNINRILAK